MRVGIGELFDLEVDPHENHDLALDPTQHVDVIESLNETSSTGTGDMRGQPVPPSGFVLASRLGLAVRSAATPTSNLSSLDDPIVRRELLVVASFLAGDGTAMTPLLRYRPNHRLPLRPAVRPLGAASPARSALRRGSPPELLAIT